MRCYFKRYSIVKYLKSGGNSKSANPKTTKTTNSIFGVLVPRTPFFLDLFGNLEILYIF